MSYFIALAASAVLGYLLGSIPFALIIGKINGIDIRTVGSKNVGATNVTRTVGKWWGKLCFLLDFLKGMLSVVAVQIAAKHFPEICDAYGINYIVAVVMPVIGHMYPVWLKFKGGKGVSTGAGAVCALAPIPILCTLIVWIVLFYATRYVSVASMVATSSLPFWAILGNILGVSPTVSKSIIIVLFILAVLVVVKHKSNIVRLLNGTESKFEKK